MNPKRRIIPVFIPHLGCPNNCVFCNQHRISGSLTAATAETVREAVDEALKILPEGGEKELAFYGGSFTAIPGDEQESLLSAGYEYVLSGKITSIRLSTRPDAIDGEVINRLHRYSVETVELGCQSMDETVLKRSGRGHSAEAVENAAKLLKSSGFRVILQMMTGLPGDTREKALETARRLCALRPDGVRIYPTVIVRDTELYDMWNRGEYREHTVEEAVSWCAELCEIFESEGIPIIRLGLNPSDDLSGGEAAGGAYHPALGEMVQSRRYLNKARQLLSKHYGENVTIFVAKGQISAMTGQKRCNVLALTEEFGLKSLKLREADMPKGSIRLEA